jgi:hypothetical protein
MNTFGYSFDWFYNLWIYSYIHSLGKTIFATPWFTVASVEVDKTVKVDYCTFAANVSLIAGKFPYSSLLGPASLLKDRTLIYQIGQKICKVLKIHGGSHWFKYFKVHRGVQGAAHG